VGTTVVAVAATVVVVVTAVAVAVVVVATAIAGNGAPAAMIANRGGNQVIAPAAAGGPNFKKVKGKTEWRKCVHFNSCLFCIARKNPKRRPDGALQNYFLASGVIFSFNRSLPRTTSISYSWSAFISPSA
jgi:hypothetical protein